MRQHDEFYLGRIHNVINVVASAVSAGLSCRQIKDFYLSGLPAMLHVSSYLFGCLA